MSLLQQTFISRSQLRSCYTRLFQSSPRHPEAAAGDDGWWAERASDGQHVCCHLQDGVDQLGKSAFGIREAALFLSLSFCLLSASPPPTPPPSFGICETALFFSLSFRLLSASPPPHLPPPPALWKTTTSSVHGTYNIFNISCCGRLAQYSHSSVDTDIQCTLSVWLSVLDVFCFVFSSICLKWWHHFNELLTLMLFLLPIPES